VQAERRRYWRPEMYFGADSAKIVRHSAAGAIVAGLLMGVAMFLVQFGIDRAMGHPREALWYSDVLMGLIAAAVTGFGLLHYQTHIQADRARMQMIGEMNHHVRNALTAISLSVYAKNDPQLEKTTRDAIQRIDWALREVLSQPEHMPGRVTPKPVESETAARRSA
jgi:ABC-type multidrug transport system fused ATPase/permease subunit